MNIFLTIFLILHLIVNLFIFIGVYAHYKSIGQDMDVKELINIVALGWILILLKK
jgi:hypothetical protein